MIKYMDSSCWIRFLSEIENLQMFSLCKEFDNLSLEDNTVGSSSSSSSVVQPTSSSVVQPSSYYGYRSMINRFLHSCRHSLWSKHLIEQIRAPIIEVPHRILSSSLFDSYNIRMGLGFRFVPGQSQFLLKELQLPQSFDRLSFLSDSLGLPYNSVHLSSFSLSPYSYEFAGLRGLVADGHSFTKILVEVITHYEGMYGRFLVLVTLGLCCTVWYTFAPGSCLDAPNSGLFGRLEAYDAFLNMDSYVPGFSRVVFVERNDVSETVVSALRNDLPFAEITIPASGNVLKAVGLGVMVAFFLAVGLVPNVTGEINVQ